MNFFQKENKIEKLLKEDYYWWKILIFIGFELLKNLVNFATIFATFF